MFKPFVLIISIVVLLIAALPDSEAQSSSYNVTSLLSWVPPKDWHSKFPYYISGFDKEGHPIILWEYGKWDIMPWMTGGDEKQNMMANYIEQAVQNLLELGKAFEDIGGTVFIADFEGLDYIQLTHFPTLRMIIRMVKYNPEVEKAMYQGIALNVNYVAENLFGIIAPIVGSSLAKSELLGTNKERWQAQLGAIIPSSQLPPWYGGSKSWKPLQLLGKGEPIDVERIRRAQLKFLRQNSA